MNNEGSIVVDEESNIPIRSDEDEESLIEGEAAFENGREQKAAKAPNPYSDFESDDENT